MRHLVAGQLVGDDHPGHVPQALEQSAEELLCGHRVSARLHQNVEHVAVLVDRAPQVPLCAVDLDEHLIQVPFVAQPRTTTAQLVRVLLPEPVAPGPDRLIGHVDTTFEHQLLHVAEAQREPVVQPDAMADDLGRKPEPLYTTSLQRSRSSILPHLTFPAHQPDSAVIGAFGHGAQQLHRHIPGRRRHNGHRQHLPGGLLPALPIVISDITDDRAAQLRGRCRWASSRGLFQRSRDNHNAF